MAEVFTTKKLADAVASAVMTTIYTVPTGTKAVVTSFMVTNTNATTTRNVTVRMGNPTLPRVVLAARPFVPGEMVTLQLNIVLASADLVQVQQDVGSDVDVLVGGVEITTGV